MDTPFLNPGGDESEGGIEAPSIRFRNSSSAAAAASGPSSAKDGGVGDAAFAAATRLSARRSLADRAYSDTACDKAVMFLEDGLHYREMVEWGDSDERSRRVYSFAYGRMWRNFYTAVLILNLSLAFVERPCTACSSDPLLAVGWQPVPGWLVYVVEYLCVAVYCADLAMQLTFMKRKAFFKSKWMRVALVVVAIMIVSPIFSLAVTGFPRLHRLVRPMLLIERFRNVRKVFSSIMRSVPAILNVMVLLVFSLIFFGVCFHIMFAGVDGEHCMFGSSNVSTLLLDGNPNLIICSTFAGNCKVRCRTASGVWRCVAVLWHFSDSVRSRPFCYLPLPCPRVLTHLAYSPPLPPALPHSPPLSLTHIIHPAQCVGSPRLFSAPVLRFLLRSLGLLCDTMVGCPPALRPDHHRQLP